MKWIFALISASAMAQSFAEFELENGVHVELQMNERRLDGRDLDNSGPENTIRRTMHNADGSAWFGYQMQVDRAGDAKFRVSFASVPGVPFFKKAPEPREIQDGDRVMMDVLVQPSTGKKVFDIFQVCLDKKTCHALPLSGSSIPDVIAAGTPLRLSHPRVGNRGLELARDHAISMDTHVAMDVPHVGRFLFSSNAAPGYRLEAVAENDKLEFIADGRDYTISTDAPVVDQPGSWLVWVRCEPQGGAASTVAVSQDGPAPLAVMTQLAETDSPEPTVYITVQNVSTKNIVAYVLQRLATNPETGKRMGSLAQTAMLTGASGPLLPGQSQTRPPRPLNFVRLTDKATPHYSIVVDLVVFEDGSAWGPMKSNQAQQFLDNVRVWLANHARE
jgi:hypothetical protein